MKPRTKFQQSVVAASKHLPPLTPAQIEWGYKNCIEHIGRRTPKGLITCTECGHTWQSENGELTDNLLGCECPHSPHPAESGNHPAPQVQRLRVFVHRNPLQGFSSPALRLYRVLGESGTDARLHPYRSRTAVDCPRRTLRNLRTAAPDGLLRSRVELVERIGTAGGERREIQHHAHTHLSPTTAYPRTAPKRLR